MAQQYSIAVSSRAVHQVSIYVGADDASSQELDGGSVGVMSRHEFAASLSAGHRCAKKDECTARAWMSVAHTYEGGTGDTYGAAQVSIDATGRS